MTFAAKRSAVMDHVTNNTCYVGYHNGMSTMVHLVYDSAATPDIWKTFLNIL